MFMFSSAVIHLPASWDALSIVKEIVLTGFTASDGVIYPAASADVLDLISLLKIEGNIIEEINLKASPMKIYEVPSEEEDPEMDEGLGGEEALSQSASQNSKRRAADQPFLAPPLKRKRRSTRPTAATVLDDER